MLLPNALHSLATRPQFVLYRTTPSIHRPGKTDKKPCDINGRELKWSDRSLWLTGEEAQRQSEESGHKIGFIFTKEDPYFFIDIDNCLVDGAWSVTAVDILTRFAGAYVEVSQSGKGLHIIAQGKTPVHKCRNVEAGVEFYSNGRFVALTGFSEQGDANLDCTPQIIPFIEAYLAGESTPGSTGELWVNWAKALDEPPHPACTIVEDDDELVARACLQRSADSTFGGKACFADLWNNEEDILQDTYINSDSGEYDRSAADAALAQLLCFWTGNDASRIERLMNESGLERDKYGRADYLPRTILKARGRQTVFYNRNFNHKNQNTVGMDSATSAHNIAPPPPSQPPANYLQRVALSKSQYLVQTDNFKPVSCQENLQQLLDYYGITVRYNNMKHEREISLPGYQAVGDKDNVMLCKIIDLAERNNLPSKRIDEQLNVIAQENAYHPIVDSMTNKPWDGVPRLKEFIGHMHTTNDEFSHMLVYRWMIASMAAAFSVDGFSQQGVLVLEGGQGIFKTTWIKSLDPINSRAVKEGAILDPNNKDHLISHFSHWLVEIAELGATKRKTDNDILKAHITTQSDMIRFPFARKPTIIPRRTSYIATVNDSRFLTDITGNRRWWTVSIESINTKHGLNMQQVWAEVAHDMLSGAKTWLDQEEMEVLNVVNRVHQVIDPIEEKLNDMFEWDTDWTSNPGHELTATGVLNLMGYREPTKSQATSLAYLLSQKAAKSKKRRYYWLPKLKIKS